MLVVCKGDGDEARSFEGACLSDGETDFIVCVLCAIDMLRAVVVVPSVGEGSVGRSRDSGSVCMGPEGGVDGGFSLCSIELGAVDIFPVHEKDCNEARDIGGSCRSGAVRGNGVNDPGLGATIVCSQRSKSESAD